MKKLLLSAALLLFAASGLHAQCAASFTVVPDTSTPYPYDMIFTNTSSPSTGSTFNWYFSGGGIPSSELGHPFSFSPTVSYPSPDSFLVELWMTNNNSSCQDSLLTYITVPGLPLSCTTSATVTQCGQCNGSASVIAAGGTQPYTYTWSNGSTSDSLINLCAGTYTVTVSDTFNLTSVCTVQVSGSSGLAVSLSTSNNAPCPNENVTITATANGSAGYSYLWSTGDTTSAISVNTSGSYDCTVTDANGCSAIDSTVVSFAPAPTISISGVNESCANCCDGSATVTVNGGSGPYSYTWSTSATAVTIDSVCPGTYTVTVEDTLYGCTFVDSITIAAFTACYSISGNVDQAILGDARVYLIEESNNVLSATDSTLADALGNYSFTNVCAGTYYVKAALLPSNPVYSTHIPTYYTGALLWSNANALVLSNASLTSVDILMIPGTNLGGPGFVSGNISLGANSSAGSPIRGGRNTISNLTFILTDENNELVAFTRSDENGMYEIQDLEMNTYKLYVDYLNRTSYPLIFTLSEATSSLSNADFILNEESIVPVNPTGLLENLQTKRTEVYPNPAQGVVNIQSTLLIDELTVYGVHGRVLEHSRVNSTGIELNLSEYDKGTYIIQVNHADQVEHHVLIKE